MLVHAQPHLRRAPHPAVVHFDFRLARERTRVQWHTVPVALPGVYRTRRKKIVCGCPWRLVSRSQVECWASRLACEVVFIYVFVKPYLRGQDGGVITWPVVLRWIPAQVSRMFSFPKKKGTTTIAASNVGWTKDWPFVLKTSLVWHAKIGCLRLGKLKPRPVCRRWDARLRLRRTRRRKPVNERPWTISSKSMVLKRLYNSLPSGPAATGRPSRNGPRPKPRVLGWGATEAEKSAARPSRSCEPKSVVSSVSVVRRPSSDGSDHHRSRSLDRKRRHGADKCQDSPRHQSSRRDSGRREGEQSRPSSLGGSSSRRRAESSSVSKALDTRPSASSSHRRHHQSSGDRRSLSSSSPRASPDRKSPPSHHERRRKSADRTRPSYVARREVPLSPKIAKPPEKRSPATVDSSDSSALQFDDPTESDGPTCHPAAGVDRSAGHGTPAGTTPAGGPDASMLTGTSSPLFPSIPTSINQATLIDFMSMWTLLQRRMDQGTVPDTPASPAVQSSVPATRHDSTPRRSDTPSRTPERRPRTPERFLRTPESRPRTPQRFPRTPVRRVRMPVRQARGDNDSRESRSRSPVSRSSSVESPTRDVSPVNFSAALDPDDKRSISDDEDDKGEHKTISAAQYQIFRQAVTTSKGSFKVNPAKTKRLSRASLLDLGGPEVTDRVSWLDQPSLQDTMVSTAPIAQGLKEDEEVEKTTLSETLNTASSTFKFFTVKQIFPREPNHLKVHPDALYVAKPPGDHGFSDNKAPSSYQVSHRMCLDTEELAWRSAI